MNLRNWICFASLIVLGWLAGCGKPPAPAIQPQATNEPARTVKTEVPPVAAPNPLEAVQKAQTELIQQLQSRLDQLEKHAVQPAPPAPPRDPEVEKLLSRIKELEGKVVSLESARILPEIALPAEPGPLAQELDQKIRVVERKNELATEAAEARAKEAPRVSIDRNGFAFRSADTNFSLRIRGDLQLDSRTFLADNPLSKGNESFLLRRARPIVEGTVFRDFEYLFVPDFAGSSPTIFDAYLNYRYQPELQLRFGKFKMPVGLEQLQSDSVLSFNERSLATDLVPNRNVGVQLWGDVASGRLNYAVGVFNGSGDGKNSANADFGDDKEVAGRIFLQPFKQSSVAALRGMGFGISGSFSQVSSNAAGLPGNTGGALPGYATDGQQQFFAYNPVIGTVVADGTHWRLSPQASYYYGPFGLLGEYVISEQHVRNGTTLREADLGNTAWQVAAQWVLTGEPASFTGVVPKSPFDPLAGQWGAWQLVARFGQLDIDSAAFQGFANPATSASSATAWGVGVNWWLNKNVRVLTSFSRTVFEGGGAYNPLDATTLAPPATVTRQDENAVFTRVQLSF